MLMATVPEISSDVSLYMTRPEKVKESFMFRSVLPVVPAYAYFTITS
jgi:hypothetical protein